MIAQVSELLNYVYGKTSVPGQIDRVSTIMRAYEGREAVLLELLETKALIKANSEKENAANLPSFLRNSPALNQNREDDMVSPLSSPNTGMNQQPVGGNIINDDISSMSGVSSPAPENAPKPVRYCHRTTSSSECDQTSPNSLVFASNRRNRSPSQRFWRNHQMVVTRNPNVQLIHHQ